jgi:hypothetical protein
MYEPHKYPDPKTPWLSHAEMSSALSDLRYTSDDHFRRCCEAKFGLGYASSSGPTISGKFSEAVTVRQEDHDRTVETIALRKEVEGLQLAVEATERQALIEADKGVEGVQRPKVKPFESRAEMQRAMSAREYRENQAVREHVEQRVKATDLSAGDFQIQIGQ